ncbi:MAG: pitrilysin family protein [Isosphaeraceae bacterium]|nr:pitrilysin family protein [Isosphaeraceae bacterium]
MTDSFRLPAFPFTKTTLSNGLDVILRRQGDLPLVAVNLWYHVGSKNEERRQRGFAHLFEHLMFEGSEHYPGDFFKPLQRLGANINGSTSTDRTNYFEDVPAAHFETALAMESDRMGHLLPALSDHKLRVQKDVVKNEYRQNYANRPYGMVWKYLAEALYPPDHPYSWLTIGVMEDVEAASREDVEAFFRRFYVPSNASLCLVGDFDEERALALAERYFGPITGGVPALKPWTPAVGLERSIALRLNDRVELERVYLCWPTVAHFHQDDAALTLLADILARGKSSRLFCKMVVERELAQDVTAYQSAKELAGTFGVYCTLRPGQSREEARDLVDAEVAAIVATGVAEEELARVRNSRLAGFLFALDNIGGFGGVADRLNAYNVYLGDPGRITTDFDRYQHVTAEAVRQAAVRYLEGRPRVSLEVVGRKRMTNGSPLDRSVPPTSAPAAPFRAPVPTQVRLASGLPIWVIQRRELPIVAMTFVLGGGASRQAAGTAGLAQLTSNLMDEGTATRSSLQLATAAEGMGTHLSTSCGWDGAYVGLQCLTPHLPASLDLAVDVLRNATFPVAEWERIHGQTLAALRAERDSAEARAYRGLLAAIYDEAHPYRLPIDGAEDVVTRLTREDVLSFHQQFHGSRGAACVVSGDVDPELIARELDARLAGWLGPELPRPEVPHVRRPGRPKIVLLDRPGAPQAVVRAGHVGIARLDPDYTDLLVMNQILGGQFTSRLNTKLREEKGFTYGIRSGFDCRRGAGPFSIGASLQSDRLGEALEDLYHEVVALVTDRPPTAGELDDARRALIEGQARHFETPSALVSRYASLYVHDLGPDHHAQFADRLAGVTVESLSAAASRQVDPAALVVVVVADAELVGPQLQKLQWADFDVSGD